MSDFYKPTKYNGATKQQMWMSIIQDSHDIHCNCTEPFCHILDCIFPSDHKDRHLTIQQIIHRGQLRCHSGGEEEESHGLGVGDSAAALIKPEPTEEDTEENLDLLFAAAAAEEEDTR